MMPLFAKRDSLAMVYQSEISDCALACLTMLCNYHGKHVSLRQLRETCRITGSGATVKDLISSSEQAGFRCRPLKLELSDLSSLKLPVILHWDLDHFVVLSKINAKSVTIYDPAVGIRSYTFSELSLHFTGIAIELVKTQSFRQHKTKDSYTLKQLFNPPKGFGRTVAQVLFMSVLIQLLSVLSPLYLQLVIDQGINLYDKDLVLLLALLFLVVTLFKSVVGYFRGLVLLQFSNQIGFQLSHNLFSHLIRLPMRFFERREIGDIVSRFGSLDSIKQLIASEMITVVVDGAFSLFTLALLYFYSPFLCFTAMVSVGLYALIRSLSLPKEKNLRQEALVANAKQHTGFIENIRTISTTKINAIENEREQDWLSSYTKQVNAGYYLGSFQLSIATAQGLVFGLDNILTIYVGAQLVFSQSLSLGQLISFIFLKQHFVSSMTALIPKVAEIKLMKLELERVSDITQQETDNVPDVNSLYQPSLYGHLKFIDVDFSYSDNTKNIFDRFNFELRPGESLGVWGASGSGKTTFLKLLLGLEKPDSGEILIDDQPILSNKGLKISKGIGAVMHGEMLLRGSLAYNIHLDLETFDEVKVMKACALTGIDDLIRSLPMGLSTQVGELGASFSAGQIQRLLLARALYQKPSILLLDESLSNLGDEAALQILKRIRDLDISMIVISHNAKLLNTTDKQLLLGEQPLVKLEKLPLSE